MLNESFTVSHGHILSWNLGLTPDEPAGFTSEHILPRQGASGDVRRVARVVHITAGHVVVEVGLWDLLPGIHRHLAEEQDGEQRLKVIFIARRGKANRSTSCQISQFVHQPLILASYVLTFGP